MEAYVLIPVFDFWNTKTQLNGNLKGNNHAEQPLILHMGVV
jgi:hypothetical protein